MKFDDVAHRLSDAKAVSSLSEDPTQTVVGDLRLIRTDQPVPTLLVLVHGWRGNDQRTWGRTPDLLLSESSQAFHVGLFRYPSGLWPWGRKGTVHLAEQLAEDIWSASELGSYQQVGIAGHSLGGLIATLAAERLLKKWMVDGKPPLVTGLLAIGTPWEGVLAARFVSWLNDQLCELTPGERASRAQARTAFEFVRRLAWTVEVQGRRDALASPLSGETKRYWTFNSHRRACAASGPKDRRLLPFLDLAKNAAQPATLLYLDALERDLERWLIRPISGNSQSELYERQSASAWTDRPDDDTEPRAQRSRERSEDGTVGDVLTLLDTATPPICLTGEGGAGKTTTVTEMAREATRRARLSPRGALVPIVLRLNDAPVESPQDRTIAASLRALQSFCQAEVELSRWLDVQAPNPMILLVDGLDEAHVSNLNLIRELALEVTRAGGRVILTGRPEAIVRDQSFRLLRLDALAPGQVERIAQRQLGNQNAGTFLAWTEHGARALLSNPGQLEMALRLWHHEGHEQPPPTSIGELYGRALPYCLARQRNPRELPHSTLAPEWFTLAERLTAALPPPAFECFHGLAGEASDYDLDPRGIGLSAGECTALERAGVIERRRGLRATTTWRFVSARWCEFFASLELRRRSETDGAASLRGTARPRWSNIWRMAAAPGNQAVLQAADCLSPMIGAVVRAAGSGSDLKSCIESLGPFNRRHLVQLLTDTPGERSVSARVALLNDLDPDVRRAAALSLRQTADQSAASRLVPFLRDSDPRVRTAAARSLRRTTDREALNALVLLLGDDNPDVRRIAARAAHGTTNKDLATALVALLRDPDSRVRRAALSGLSGTTVRGALDGLASLLRDHDFNVRRVAAVALRRTTDQDAVKNLIDLLRDAYPSVRRAATAALQGTTDRGALDSLIAILRDADPFAGADAAQALRGTTDDAALDGLITSLHDKHHQVRIAAAGALRGTTIPRAVDGLIGLLHDASIGVRAASARALAGTTDRDALAGLAALLRDDAVGVRAASARALAGTTDQEALAGLVALLHDDHVNVRAASAQALAGTADQEALAGLVALLHDDHVTGRAASAQALAGTADQEALAGLVALLHDDHMTGRTVAARSLRGTHDQATIDAVVRLLFDSDTDVRAAAAEALRGTTDENACDALIDHLSDENAEVRLAAARTIRFAPQRSGMAQRLLAGRQRRGASPEIDNAIHNRLLTDDVPFADWPAG